jgi:hypothetical protein
VADPSERTQISRAQGAGEPTSGSDTAELVGAIRELSARVGNLQAEVHTLRAGGQSLPPAAEPAGWDDQRGGGADPLTWVSALDAPSARSPAVPRLLLEIVFLVAVAVAAAIAELGVGEIVAVMAIAWILVALAEWAGARAAQRRADAVYAPLPGLTPGYPTDPSWFAPPVERTVLEVVDPGEDTQTKLPPPGEDS